jgi:hypothetical protein
MDCGKMIQRTGGARPTGTLAPRALHNERFPGAAVTPLGLFLSVYARLGFTGRGLGLVRGFPGAPFAAAGGLVSPGSGIDVRKDASESIAG